MNEQGFFERIREGAKSYLNPLHGTEDCLLFMIEENVKPRDSGTLFVACGNKTVFEVPNLALCGSDPERAVQAAHPRKCAARLFVPQDRVQERVSLAAGRNPEDAHRFAGRSDCLTEGLTLPALRSNGCRDHTPHCPTP
jgi:hypothetical protein